MEKKTFSFEYEILKEEELTEKAMAVINEAKKASEGAYVPYSNFQVGAAVLLDNGLIIKGNNQENVAFPSGLCAERVTLFAANANYPDSRVLTLAVAAQMGGKFTASPVTPCGACRQVINGIEERQKSQIEVYLYGSQKIIHVKCSSDLLPLAFDF